MTRLEDKVFELGEDLFRDTADLVSTWSRVGQDLVVGERLGEPLRHR